MATRVSFEEAHELKLVLVASEDSSLREFVSWDSAHLSEARTMREMVGVLSSPEQPALVIIDGTHPNLLAITGIMQALRDDLTHVIVYPETIGLTQLRVPIEGAHSCTRSQLLELLHGGRLSPRNSAVA